MHKPKENKEDLIRLATTGGLRPPYKEQLGTALKNYCNPINPAYDREFAEKIKTERPDWFEKSSTKNKAILLQQAKSGVSRKELSAKLKVAFNSYVKKGGTSYDPVFEALIRQHAPVWFEKLRKANRSHQN